MGFSISYGLLFTVNVFHDFFLNKGEIPFEQIPEPERHLLDRDYDIRKVFRVVPTSATEEQLKNYGLLYRNSKKGFFVGVRLDPQSGQEQPDVSLERPMTLTFALHLVDPYFLNYTSLPLGVAGFRPYYFSNRSGNGWALSKPIEPHNPNRRYQSGELHVFGGELFEAMQNNGPGARDPADWTKVEPVRAYASTADQLPLYPPLFSARFEGAAPALARADVFPLGSSTRIYTQTERGVPSLSAFPVDLRTLGPGAYELKFFDNGTEAVTDRSGPFYLDAALYGSRIFGLLEIHHDPAGAAPEERLVDRFTQQVLSPVFELRFKNRRTYWRYVFNQVQNPLGLGELEEDSIPGFEDRRFRTKQSRPLTRASVPLNRFDSTNVFLPSPDIRLVKPERDDRIYSETFMPI